MEIMEILNNLDGLLNDFLNNAGVLAPILSCLLIFLEGILAFLPLFVFVTFNIMSLSTLLGDVLGTLLGIALSWVFTTLGSYVTFMLFRKFLNKPFRNKIARKQKSKKFMKIVDNLKYSQLVLIISIPFSPSFFINLGAGLSNINAKKYLCALLIGKISQMLFLGYVGVSLVECLTNPMALIKVVLILAVGYVVSVIVNKKFNLDERFE